MTREEMILIAQETRKNVTNAPVSKEELDAFPVTMEKLAVPTREGDAVVYLSSIAAIPGNNPVVINLHGGGFIRERTLNDELYCRRITHAMNCKVLDIDYKIAPDYPFPAALYECYDVVKWVREHAEQLDIDPERIILNGHSAGGNLVSGINILSGKTGDFRIFLNVMDYPPMDIYTDPADKKSRGKGIPNERARLYNLFYCDRSQQNNPLASPVFATEEMLAGFPPTLMITAGEDVLCTEAEQYALKLAQAGVEVTLKRFPEEGHAFTIYRRGEWKKATELIIKFMKNHINEF